MDRKNGRRTDIGYKRHSKYNMHHFLVYKHCVRTGKCFLRRREENTLKMPRANSGTQTSVRSAIFGSNFQHKPLPRDLVPSLTISFPVFLCLFICFQCLLLLFYSHILFLSGHFAAKASAASTLQETRCSTTTVETSGC